MIYSIRQSRPLIHKKTTGHFHGIVDDKVIIGMRRLKLHLSPDQPLLDFTGLHLDEKPVTLAIHEVADGKLTSGDADTAAEEA